MARRMAYASITATGSHGEQIQMRPKQDARNRIIYAAWKAGTPVAQLSIEFGLKIPRISSILLQESHKIAVSPDPFYRHIRKHAGELASAPGNGRSERGHWRRPTLM